MNPLDPIVTALQELRLAWGDAGVAADGLSRAQLIAVNDALGALKRCSEAVHAQVAGAIARESRTELGADSLAKVQGFRTPAQLIAATVGTSAGDAARLVKVGEAIAPRRSLTGEVRPAKYPRVRDALTTGQIGALAASLMTTMLERIRVRVPVERIEHAEELLVTNAPGLTIDQLRTLIVRAEAWCDPDGVEPREEALRAQRSLTTFERDGMLHLTATLDPVSGAVVKTALGGYVSAQFHARSTTVDPEAVDADRRTVPMMQADALVAFAEHTLGCAHSDVPLDGAQVVLRVSLDDITTGVGTARLDGIAQPISIATARQEAATGSVLPWVCGADGDALDLGRSRRMFTRGQKHLLAERDGGCAMCALPPIMTKAHHIRWWARDNGPTDLNNGVLLCTSCHHRIHDNGWDIRIDGHGITARVWFIPPPTIDPQRTPRLGGRARFDLAA